MKQNSRNGKRKDTSISMYPCYSIKENGVDLYKIENRYKISYNAEEQLNMIEIDNESGIKHNTDT